MRAHAAMVLVQCALWLLFATSAVLAQAPHDTIKPNLVFLQAVAEKTTGGQKVSSISTGFVVSPNGLVLTVYSLLTTLGDVRPETIDIKADVGSDNPNPTSRAAVVDLSPDLNLLLLRVFSGAVAKGVELGKPNELPQNAAIFSSGYLEDAGGSVKYKTHQGIISDMNTADAQLWTTNIPFKKGEIGSPVYNDKGQVVGIARGQHPQGGLEEFFIPIDFADPLLAGTRVLEIQQIVKKIVDDPERSPEQLAIRIKTIQARIDALQRYVTWQGTIETADDGRETVRISYEKALKGEPFPKKISIKITPMGHLPDGRIKLLDTIPPKTYEARPRPNSNSTDSAGYFELEKAATAGIDYLKSIPEVTDVALNVEFIVTLSDGTELPTKTMTLKR